MKPKYKKKVWWNWTHLVVIVLGLIYALYNIGKGCVYGQTWSDCFSQQIFLPLSLLGILIIIIVSYLLATLISWMYYKDKK